ncbi:MAG TPA: hypothetical protein DEO86_06410, partial [Colwellia sp.]|nr:hypothetical protein [Colwellia sp.]
MPVEPIVEGDNTAEALSHSTKETVGKVSRTVQSKGDIEESIVKTVKDSISPLKASTSDAETETFQINKVNSGNKVDVERSLQATVNQ